MIKVRDSWDIEYIRFRDWLDGCGEGEGGVKGIFRFVVCVIERMVGLFLRWGLLGVEKFWEEDEGFRFG